MNLGQDVRGSWDSERDTNRENRWDVFLGEKFESFHPRLSIARLRSSVIESYSKVGSAIGGSKLFHIFMVRAGIGSQSSIMNFDRDKTTNLLMNVICFPLLFVVQFLEMLFRLNSK